MRNVSYELVMCFSWYVKVSHIMKKVWESIKNHEWIIEHETVHDTRKSKHEKIQINHDISDLSAITKNKSWFTNIIAHEQKNKHDLQEIMRKLIFHDKTWKNMSQTCESFTCLCKTFSWLLLNNISIIRSNTTRILHSPLS